VALVSLELKASCGQNLTSEEGRFSVKQNRFDVEQIVAALKQAKAGAPLAELFRRAGISGHTFYRWKKLYAGLEAGQVRRPKQLRKENTRFGNAGISMKFMAFPRNGGA